MEALIRKYGEQYRKLIEYVFTKDVDRPKMIRDLIERIGRR